MITVEEVAITSVFLIVCVTFLILAIIFCVNYIIMQCYVCCNNLYFRYCYKVFLMSITTIIISACLLTYLLKEITRNPDLATKILNFMDMDN